jgi:prolyl oligopeptidase
MKLFTPVLLLGISSLTLPAVGAPPPTEARPVINTYHGVEVVDPFQWLEGDNSNPANMGRINDEVAAWTDQQNAYTRSVLDNLPGRAALEKRISELLEVPSIGTPRVYGDRYFYSRREGTQNQSLHYVRDGLDGDERLLLDPNRIDTTGLTTISWTAPSHDGTLMAFGSYRSGDENSTLYVMDVTTGEWLAEEIPGKVSLAGWDPDNRGFIYRRLESLDDAYSGVYKHHRLGTHHSQDAVLFRQKDIGFFYANAGYSDEKLESLKTTWGPFGSPSDDGRWMLVGYFTGTLGADLWMADLDAWRRTGTLELVEMARGQTGRVSATHFSGDRLYMQTAIGAPNGRVVMVDLNNPGMEHWTDIIPESESLVLSGASFARGIIAADYLDQAKTRITLFDMRGNRLRDLDLPGIGSAGLSASDDRTEAFLAFSSYNMPRSIYRVDLATGERELWARPDVPVDPAQIEVRQVWYPSKDGTEVSMFIVHKKGLTLDGTNPTILFGYGGFNISMTPGFSSTMFPWYENGGVYAVANLRGGGEYGKAWHQAGMLENKQNVFDDFIAAGEWLIEQGYTSPEHLGIVGGSNGGLLTGAAVVQRPDLFAAAISAVPLLDMLRFEQFLMARYWVPEYGSAASPGQFEYLRAYSPYHNIEAGVKYPAVLITAGENDTRVHPLHARKMGAALQAATASDPDIDPVLIWVDRDAGHGGGKPRELQVRDIADQRIFMMWQLGMLEE